MTIPLDRNVALKEIEKKSNYKDLQLECGGCWYAWYSKEGDGRASERATVTEPKRSACWDLHESSGRCLVYKQNDWLEWHSRNESRPKSMRRDKPLHGKFLSIAEGQPQETDRNFQWLVSCELKITSRGVATFSTCCSPGWLHFHTSVKIAHMTNKHWPHQSFELLSFLAHPNNA